MYRSVNLFTEGMRNPEPFAQAKCTISTWFMWVRSHYSCPNENPCLMPLLGGFLLECLFMFIPGLKEFDGKSVYTFFKWTMLIMMIILNYLLLCSKVVSLYLQLHYKEIHFKCMISRLSLNFFFKSMLMANMVISTVSSYTQFSLDIHVKQK